MAPTRFRVKRLARECGLDVEEAILVLMDRGFDVADPDDIIERRDSSRARDLLREFCKPPAVSVQAEFVWPDLKVCDVSYLDLQTVLDIHGALTAEFRGSPDAVEPPGVRDQRLLASAVARPVTAAAKYPNVLAAGSALVHGLIHNHPFHNGNKRTALISLVVFLERENRYFLEFDEDGIYELIVSIADHSIVAEDPSRTGNGHSFLSDREVLAILYWLEAHTSAPTYGDRRIRWRDLEMILRRLGCEVESSGNLRKVRRDGLWVNTGARNAGTQMERDEMRRIRRELRLDAEHGVDSRVFYEGEAPYPPLGDIIARYRGVLERLSLLDRT